MISPTISGTRLIKYDSQATKLNRYPAALLFDPSRKLLYTGWTAILRGELIEAVTVPANLSCSFRALS
jgi:hypothetical protein